MPEVETKTLFDQFLDVCNRALVSRKDSFPYKQMIGAAGKVFGDRNIGMAIYADDPDTPFDYYTVRFKDGKLEPVGHGKSDPKFSCKISQDYLKKIAENPQAYIDHPEKLDWDWLKSRLGL